MTINLSQEVSEILRKTKEDIGIPFSVQIEKAILGRKSK